MTAQNDNAGPDVVSVLSNQDLRDLDLIHRTAARSISTLPADLPEETRAQYERGVGVLARILADAELPR